MTEVIVLDVGHGNCTIVRSGEVTAVVDCPAGAMLIDTLCDLKVTLVEAAVISHADKDHIAGILALLTSDRISVNSVFVNPDSQKNTRIWQDFRVAVAIAERRGDFQVITSLSSTTPGSIAVGEATIKVICPSAALALTGIGGKTSAGRTITSNSLSGVLRIEDKGKGRILLAADLDDLGLEEALSAGIDLSADLLVFPHHGGLPGGIAPGDFAAKLLDAVNPASVVFSNGRGRYDNPRQEIVDQVCKRGCSVACTQLSTRCVSAEVDSGPYLEPLRADGRTTGTSCAGSMTWRLEPQVQRLADAQTRHHRFIDKLVDTPMCVSHRASPV